LEKFITHSKLLSAPQSHENQCGKFFFERTKMTEQLLRRYGVEQITGMSKSGLYRAMAEGNFPRPVKIGQRAVAWRASDIAKWLESRTTA
jgi:prophage regulatory protein